MNKKTLIIQTSPFHTASTLLVNILYGLLPGLFDKKIIGTWTSNWSNIFKHSDIIVLKNHDTNIDKFIRMFGNRYNLYFVCSERKEKKYFINPKYKKYKNVVTFDFAELLETNENSVEDIVKRVHDKLQILLENSHNLNLQNGIKRVNDMNDRYKCIQDKPFSYIDPFYEIHGSHRNRKNLK